MDQNPTAAECARLNDLCRFGELHQSRIVITRGCIDRFCNPDEPRFVTVRRVVPHRHLVAGLHPHPAEFDVLGQVAPHEDHRRRPAHDLLDGGVRHPVEVGPPPGLLVGVPGQRDHPVADRIAGGFIARTRQQDEKRRDFRRRQPLTVDVGLHQVGRQVVGGLRTTGLGQRRAVGGEFQHHRDELVAVVRHFLVAGTEKHGRPMKHLGFVLFGDAHHVADDLQRKRSGDGLDEVCLPVRVIRHQIADQPARPGPDVLFDPRHHLRGERPVDDRPQALMARVVQGDHRTGELRHGRIDVRQCRTGRNRAEHLRMPTRLVDMVERGQCPVSGPRLETGEGGRVEEFDRRFPSQRGEGPVAVIVVPGPERQLAQVDVRQRYIRRR